ncbi:NHLP-related RiPP peptide [Stenotrophomonas sp.]|uniref:NHLP-related RiPP peptide n=1 Tax=Stenotrophomonas sp. TaxID=69392 RepID=UPI002D5EF48A|nr:NHLP-related RiPP peptide [Stenotrophomonas sp.]HYQ22684.1 NHLP-related RiPP peptide [Stenotrophomonas sp.]
MSTEGNNPQSHPAFTTEFATHLLDLLSSDDAFRTLFVSDAHAALVQAGLTSADADAALVGDSCMRPETLASKEEIAAARDALLESMTSQTAHTVPFCLLT